MKNKLPTILWTGLLCTTVLAGALRAQSTIPASMDESVAAFRKIIVLMDGAGALDAGNHERVRNAAWILFEQNRDRLKKLEDDLGVGLATHNAKPTEEFLTCLESNPDYRDADKLAFRDLLEGVAISAKDDNAGAPLQKRIADDVAAIEEIHGLYQKEITQIFAGLETRGMPVRREAWANYVSFLKTKYQREQILKEYEKQLPAGDSRGGAQKKNDLEVFGTEMPPKTIALTFDDGPHPRYTDQILAILKKYGLQAVFFEVGQNLGTVNEKGEVKLGPIAPASYRILEAGSFIGNHSYTHPVLPKMTEAGYTKEIDTTSELLAYIRKGEPDLFRPPYGATNQGILTKVQSEKMKTIIWNVDSEDWADPVPNSVAQRVVTEAEKQGRGIILFHDIHKVGIEALPTVIETLQQDGFKFVSWNGTAFAPSETRGGQAPVVATAPATQPYRESWAALIGIDDYDNWQKLSYASHDAQAVKDLLVQKYNFKPDHIFTLFDKDATRENILSLLGDKLANGDMVKHEDRVFVFYAGHGATRKLASGRELGYIIPVDADLTNYEGSAISMTNFQDIAEAIPAKHLLFVMDSCYSGLALTRGGGMAGSQNYLNEIARREARQMFTAGGADQQVADNGPNGHSVFTWTLLQALDGRADLNGDGVITATELAAYVAPAVSALSHQTPSFGNLPGSEGGDFIFEWKHETEFLNEDSSQLGDDAIKLNSELDKLRKEMQQQASENEELRKQLADAQQQLKQGAQAQTVAAAAPPPMSPVNSLSNSAASSATSAPSSVAGTTAAPNTGNPAAASSSAANTANPAAASSTTLPAATTPTAPEKLTSDAAAALNDEGMRLYKEKKYADAAAKFVEASNMQPTSALFANNTGFAYYRLTQYPSAVQWFLQAIALDPKRSVAYLNLGDAYWELKQKSDAKDAYEKFLALSPNSKSAPAVREKLKSLP